MCHTMGQVKFRDDTIMHYEYDGTSDVVCNCLYDTPEEVHKNWRVQPSNECMCGKDEEVIIANNYGGGEFYKGRACRYCRAITKGLGTGIDDPGFDDVDSDMPDWWKE